MMTVHTAKGLEFPHVFLVGMEEGVFPSKKTSTIEAMEEERRLAFVAVTRAERSLALSESEGRNFDGSFRYPSRFLFNIDEALLLGHKIAFLEDGCIKKEFLLDTDCENRDLLSKELIELKREILAQLHL